MTGDPDLKAGHYLCVSVTDSGTGMDEATLQRAMEPFFTTKGERGTGLGLWVSNEIVEKHHGTLRARSREAREGRPGGTVFTLFLPSDSPDPEATNHPESLPRAL